MSTVEQTPEQCLAKAEQKKLYMREYMRTYKAKKYAENPDSARRANNLKYLKKTQTVNIDDKKLYGEWLPAIFHLRKIIADLTVANRLDLLTEFFVRDGSVVEN